MDSETNDAKELRSRANQLRNAAEQAANPASRDVYLDLAGTYDRLAQQTEERAQRRSEGNGQPAPGKDSSPPRASQPSAPKRTHRFKIGQTVYFGPPGGGLLAAPAPFRIIHLLPSEGAENRYWIKSIADGDERIAQESQLHPAPADAPQASKGKG